MNRSTPGLPVHHHLPEFTQTHVNRVRDAIQPSHPRSSPSPPAPIRMYLFFQELTTVKDEEMDFTCVEEEQMNSARRYMGMDMKVENCGNLVFWGKKGIFQCILLTVT